MEEEEVEEGKGRRGRREKRWKLVGGKKEQLCWRFFGRVEEWVE